MSVKPETTLVQNCLAWLKAQQGDGYHVHGSAMQRAGEPDIDGWVPDLCGGFLHLKVEAKVGKNKPSKLQEKRLEVYGKSGYITGVIYTENQFISLIEEARAKRRNEHVASDT